MQDNRGPTAHLDGEALFVHDEPRASVTLSNDSTGTVVQWDGGDPGQFLQRANPVYTQLRQVRPAVRYNMRCAYMFASHAGMARHLQLRARSTGRCHSCFSKCSAARPQLHTFLRDCVGIGGGHDGGTRAPRTGRRRRHGGLEDWRGRDGRRAGGGGGRSVRSAVVSPAPQSPHAANEAEAAHLQKHPVRICAGAMQLSQPLLS